MTPPVRPEAPHPAEYLQYLREVKPEEAKLYEQYLTETGQAHHIATAGRQQEYRSGRLERRVARENVNDQEALALAQEEDRAGRSYLGGALQRIPAALSALSKDIPGAEAAQAFVRSKARGQPYEEALGDIREGYEGLNVGARVPLRIVGGGTAASALPIASPAMAGATYGALSGALDADPASLGERALNTGINAAVGGAVGKVGDVATTAVRAGLAKRLPQVQAGIETAAAAKTAPLYAEALEQGVGRTGTPAVRDFLARPQIQDIVTGLRQFDEFAGMAPDDPRMLDEIYKVLSDQSATVGKRMAMAEPAKPNLGRAAAREFGNLRGDLLDVLSGGSDAPMPSYEPAVKSAAQGFATGRAAERGYNLASVETGGGYSPRNLAKYGHEGFEKAMERATPEMERAAAEGVLAFGKRKLSQGGVTGLLNPLRGQGRNFLTDGGDLLRMIEGTASTNAGQPLTAPTLLDYLRRTGVAAVTPDGF